MSKTGVWIAIVIVILALLGWWYVAQHPAATGSQAAPGQTSNTQSATGAQGGASGAGALSSGTSDASLNADLQTIDGQMQSANSAGASAQSFSDTPVQQTE